MRADIDRVLISREQIGRRVRELAEQITRDHARRDGPGEEDEGGKGGEPAAPAEPEVTIVPVLTGAMIFCADLIRHIPLPIKIGLLTVSSYPGRSLSTQGSQLLHDQLGDVAGRHVLVVDDILDSGGTLRLIVPRVREMGAASVRTCVLLRKDRPAARETPVDYWGFEIPDLFVVGYGLDYNNYYRNLPDIVTLKPDAIARSAEARGAAKGATT